MYVLKTKENDNDVVQFIESVENPKKREDAYQLLDIFTETTGYKAKMWGKDIIGFGSYHYVYDSGHQGDAPLVGFSPKKAKFSLYFATGQGDVSLVFFGPDYFYLLNKVETGKAMRLYYIYAFSEDRIYL